MTEALTVRVDAAQIWRVKATLEAIGKSADGALARAVNHTGDLVSLVPS